MGGLGPVRPLPAQGPGLAAGGWPGGVFAPRTSKRLVIYGSVYRQASPGQDPGGSSQENLALRLPPAAAAAAASALSVGVSG